MFAEPITRSRFWKQINYGPFFVSITGARRARIRYRRKIRHHHSAAPRAGVKNKYHPSLIRSGAITREFLIANFQSLTNERNSVRTLAPTKVADYSLELNRRNNRVKSSQTLAKETIPACDAPAVQTQCNRTCAVLEGTT